jgi:hypothetical protein
MMSLVCLMMGLNARWLASKSYTRRVQLRSGDNREGQFHRAQLWLLLSAQYLAASMCAWMSIALRGPHALPEPWGLYGGFAIPIAIIPVFIYVAIRYGQGGWRLPGSNLSATQPIGDQTPDNCWKLGRFYFNPADPALWVETRAGFGYTMNFARPLSWVWILAAVAGPPLLMRFFR